MYEATQILTEAVERLYKLCDALLPLNHTAALAVESLGIELERVLAGA